MQGANAIRPYGDRPKRLGQLFGVINRPLQNNWKHWVFRVNYGNGIITKL